MSDSESVSDEKVSAASGRREMSRARWFSLALAIVSSAAFAVSSARMLAVVDGPPQQDMFAVICGAVAVMIPSLWLIFLSPFSSNPRLLGPVIVFLGTAIYMQSGEPTEQALCNIMTLVFSVLAVVSLVAWMLSVSRATAYWNILIGLAAAAFMFFAIFRLESPTGNMVPRVRYRYATPPDQLLEQPATRVSARRIDLYTPSSTDFPRFLGPRQDLRVVEPVLLETNWQKSPPKLVWRQPIGAGWSAFAIVGNHAVTMEQRDTEELVTCYCVDDGKLVWSHGITARHETALGGIGPRSTPTIFRGRVYALGATGVLRCLDGATGRLLWWNDLLAEQGTTPEVEAANIAWGRAASPLVIGDMVIVPAGGPDPQNCVSLIAYDAYFGDRYWKGGASQVSYCSPQEVTLHNVQQVLIVNEASVAGHHIGTGEQLWSFPWDGTSNAAANCTQAHILPGDRVLISKGYGSGAAVFQVALQDGKWSVGEEPIWRNSRVLKTKFSNTAVVGDDVYGLSEGVLECVSAATGERKWRGGRYGHGQILLVGDALLVLGEAGELAIGKATSEGWDELGMIQALEGKTWNNLALTGDKLLIRNGEEAACYQLPTRKQ